MGDAPVDSGHPDTEAPAPSNRRRRAGVIAGCVLLLAALVGGTGYTAVTVRDADRDPGGPVWRLPEAAASGSRTEATGLQGMLLPYGTSGYGRGPDLGVYGADVELSGAQAAAMRKESFRDLPRSQRRQVEKQIDKQHITGMAMRSYVSPEDVSRTDAADAEDAFVVEIVLSRMDNRRSVRSAVAFQQEFFEAMKIFRAGPRIKGHENARCFLPPADSKERIDLVICSAYQGDVLVSATAYGPKPLDKKAVARMLGAQLDRIKDPGKAV
ncbi:hypothetical protein ACWEQ7_20120 [Streptomyces sp. NPDC004069]